MDTTINASVSQVNAYTNASAGQKKSSDKAAGASEEGKQPSEVPAGDAGVGSETADRVDITATRLVSESNRAASETEVEDIDSVARRIQELKQWFASEQESAQAQQVHQLDASSLVDVLS